MEVITNDASTPLSAERIDYEFKCGIKAWQGELTLKQDRRINELINGLDKNIFRDITKIQISELINVLFEKGLIDKLLNIVLHTEELDYSELTNSEMEKVVTDFFTLNPTLKKWFGTGKQEAAGIQAQPKVN